MNCIDKKVWVFQSKRKLSEEEENNIIEILSEFQQIWNAHGASIESDIRILNKRFILVIVDENLTKLTGCSIDSLNNKIKEIDQKYKFSLLDRSIVCYEENDNIKTMNLLEFKQKIKSKKISKEQFVYNLSVNTLSKFEENFRKPIKDSWAKIYL